MKMASVSARQLSAWRESTHTPYRDYRNGVYLTTLGAEHKCY